MVEHAAIVGVGFIGRAWAIAFARAGWRVALWDPQAGPVERCVETIDSLLDDLASQRLLSGEAPAEVAARLRPAMDLRAALDGAAWVQENAPETVEVKRELWAELDRLAPPDAILASSSSAIAPSQFTESLGCRHRWLVAHPLNPPSLISAVELVPAPWTAPATMQRAEAVMRGIGQAPIVRQRELDSFVMNRMQGVLLEEAFHLVADGYCTIEGVDVGLREGLALRWSFIGPFETIDLKTPSGVADYVGWRWRRTNARRSGSLGTEEDATNGGTPEGHHHLRRHGRDPHAHDVAAPVGDAGADRRRRRGRRGGRCGDRPPARARPGDGRAGRTSRPRRSAASCRWCGSAPPAS